VGQKVSEFALSYFGFGKQSNHVGQTTKGVQEFSIKLLGINDIKDTSILLKRFQFFINGFANKFVPSVWFARRISPFFFSCRVVRGYRKLPVTSSGRWMRCGE
jgi:hypothetical protein